METANKNEADKKSALRWQLINSPQGLEFLNISFGLYGLCGVGFIFFGLASFIVRALIVATICLLVYFIYSLRKRPME
jgi:hypothetical protein